MVWLILKATLFSFIRLYLRKVKGKQNIPKKRNFIIVANHESYIDPFLIGSVVVPYLDKKTHFLTMKGRPFRYLPENFYKKFCGIVIMERNKEKTYQKLLKVLQSGEILALFPGGPRSNDGRMTRGRTGTVRLALEAKVPIVPVGLKGTFDIAPRDQIRLNWKRATMVIGKPIYLDQYYNKPVAKKLLKILTTDMMKSIAKLARKKYLYS